MTDHTNPAHMDPSRMVVPIADEEALQHFHLYMRHDVAASLRALFESP